MESNEFIEKFFDPDKESFGFEEVVYKRQAHLNRLRKKLRKYYLSDEEIDKLFIIIDKAQIAIEKLKRSSDYKNASHGDVIKITQKILEVQRKMKTDFETKLNETIKKKYEKAKKELEKINKNKNKNKNKK